MTDQEYFNNIKIEPVEVRHQDLQRLKHSESAFRSHCPFCAAGVLLMGRDQEHLFLLATDRCILCGRSVIYTDIEENSVTLKYKNT